jgi:hypothetical protein
MRYGSRTSGYVGDWVVLLNCCGVADGTSRRLV